MGNITSLGGVVPLLNQSLSGFKNLETNLAGNRAANERAALQQAQLAESNRLEEQVAVQKAARDTALLNAQQQDTAHKRNLSLRRALARQRAQYGASGVENGGDTGSGAAVLSGLLDESTQENTADTTLYDLRRQIINDNLDQLRTKNLLSESQLAARRKIKSGGVL